MSTGRILELGRPLRTSILLKPTSGKPFGAYREKSVQLQPLPPPLPRRIFSTSSASFAPTSPHLSIYKPQVTSVLSIWAIVTVGGALSVLLYGFSLAYLFAPETFDSTQRREFVAGLPDSVKYAGKAILAAPFAFHSLNGMRHLAWDMGKFMTNQKVTNRLCCASWNGLFLRLCWVML
ncbi:succinate dehydrogenase cytochrome b560 subunit [Mycena olivaceomarginata]|nr:succinate dehydrogenase cytochrome b560 subunit [Mycena olivaceomarginata]